MDRRDVLQVTTTTDSREAADRLARSAVEGRVAACAQVVGPIGSVYRWEGKVDSAEEWQVLLKTTGARWPELRAHLVAHHSYDVPEIICIPVVGGNPEYLDWVRTETGGA